MTQHQKFSINSVATIESPFTHKHAFMLQMMRRGYVWMDMGSSYRFNSSEDALEAGKTAAELYEQTGQLPTLH